MSENRKNRTAAAEAAPAHKGPGVDEPVGDLRALWLLRAMLGIGAVLPAAFVITDFFSGDTYKLALGFGTSAFLGMLFIALRRPDRYRLILRLMIAAVGALVLYLVLSPRFDLSAGMWMLIYPVVTMFLLGPDVGAVASAAFLVIADVGLAIMPRDIYPPSALYRLSIIYLAIASVTYYYERGRRRALQQSRVHADSLAHAAERYRRLFEQSSDGVLLLDTRQEIVDVNPAACALLRYAPDELCGKQVRALVAEDSLWLGERVLAEGTRFETELRRRDGSVVPVEVGCGAIEGDLAVVQCILRDISIRRDHERRQREHTAALRTLSESASQFLELPSESNEIERYLGTGLVGLLRRAVVLVSEVDGSGTGMVVKGVWAGDEARVTAAVDILGYRLDGRRFAVRDGLLPSLAQDRLIAIEGGAAALGEGVIPTAVLQAIERVLGLGATYLMGLVRHRRVVGSVSIFMHSGDHIDNPGLVEAFVRQASTAFHRRALERELRSARETAERSNRAKSEFLANTSHEIRTPMNAIVGMTELALARAHDSELRGHLDIIRKSAFSLLDIIDNILDLSKIESGRLELESIPFDLRSLVESAAQTVRYQAVGKGLALRTEVAADVPPWVCGDPTRVRQVLINLLSNAVKFTDRGSVVLSVDRPAPEEQAVLRFTVRDTGVGIPGEKLQTIFESFVQADGSTTRTHGGSGLGLSISRHLAAMMNGSLAVESEVGAGSAFTFSAPFETANGDTARAAKPIDVAKPAAVSDASQRAPTVLVAEDNDLNRMILVKMLGTWGFTVLEARHGEEAVSICVNGGIDLVLMDVQMPVMDGLAATRRIRARLGTCPPVVALTAHAMKEDRESCLAAGMDDYLSKPFRPDDVRAVVARYCGSRAPARATSGSDGTCARFDEADLVARLGGDCELYVETVRIFLETGNDRRRLMLNALSRAHADEISKIAHTIKGVALTISAPRLRRCAEALENACRAGARDEIASRGAELLDEYDRLSETLRTRVS